MREMREQALKDIIKAVECQNLALEAQSARIVQLEKLNWPDWRTRCIKLVGLLIKAFQYGGGCNHSCPAGCECGQFMPGNCHHKILDALIKQEKES